MDDNLDRKDRADVLQQPDLVDPAVQQGIDLIDHHVDDSIHAVLHPALSGNEIQIVEAQKLISAIKDESVQRIAGEVATVFLVDVENIKRETFVPALFKLKSITPYLDIHVPELAKIFLGIIVEVKNKIGSSRFLKAYNSQDKQDAIANFYHLFRSIPDTLGVLVDSVCAIITEVDFDTSSISDERGKFIHSLVLREKLLDPSYLPTRDEIYRAFVSKKDWYNFIDQSGHTTYEFLNEEFISALADYLSQRIEALGASVDSPVTILEAGAGNGRLSHFLRQKLEEKLPGKVKVVAVDQGSWGLRSKFPVEDMDHNEALKKYKPQIVLFSWIPPGADPTADFRAEKSVDEYILIGEADSSCGSAWYTWGENYSGRHDGEVAPYEADGFEREKLEDISLQQISRASDWEYLAREGYSRSTTESFRRSSLPTSPSLES